MRYNIAYTNQCKKDIALAKKRGLDIDVLIEVVEKLSNNEPLPAKNKDHQLKGNYFDEKNCRECHIHPDWLLIYKKEKELKLLELIRIGTHSDLF